MLKEQIEDDASNNIDVVIVGAGFAGLYMLYQLCRNGFSARVFDAADDIGRTWYWNRYPGAHATTKASTTPIPSMDALLPALYLSGVSLRLLLGRRYLSAGTGGRSQAMHPCHHWYYTGGTQGTGEVRAGVREKHAKLASD